MPFRDKLRLIAGLVVGLAALSWAGAASASTLLECDPGMPRIQVALPNAPEVDATLWLENEQLAMSPAVSGSGFRYVVEMPDGVWEVYGRGDEVHFQRGDEAPMPCLPEGTGAARQVAAPASVVSSVGNFSLGGNVRSGPGTDHDRVASLELGEPVVLIERSGVEMDGYEWFRIEFGGGQEGYQWGGIMCSNALHIVGLYDPCPDGLE